MIFIYIIISYLIPLVVYLGLKKINYHYQIKVYNDKLDSVPEIVTIKIND